MVTEGSLIGITGSAAGAALGLAGAAVFSGQLPPLLLAVAAIAVATGAWSHAPPPYCPPTCSAACPPPSYSPRSEP